MIQASALIAKFQSSLDDKWGYIYGKSHDLWNEAKQEAYNKAKKDDTNCQNSIKYGPKWYGHWVTDCSGLFSYWFGQLGGKMYHGSHTMYNSWCVEKGQLKNGKRTDGKELKPGTAVFVWSEKKKRYSHVGLYIGGGWVIEAAGAKDGVCRSKITNSKWSHWGLLKGVEYNVKPEPVPEGYAEVTGTRVALRSAPSKSASIIMRIDTGNRVKMETPPPSEWDYVSYNGKKGYMMKEFLKEG